MNPPGKRSVYTPRTIARDVVFVFLGIVGLVLGAFAIRESATALAEAMGISELVIGVTLVSIGTSLPEFATCAVSAWRLEADIAAGNILSSNVFNISGVLRATALVAPLQISPDVVRFEFPAMMFITVLMVSIVRMRLVIRRREGPCCSVPTWLWALGSCYKDGSGVHPTRTREFRDSTQG
jgi:cation:H+ antiporter